MESFGFPIFPFLASPDEGYSRNASCAMNLISTFVLLIRSWRNLYLILLFRDFISLLSIFVDFAETVFLKCSLTFEFVVLIHSNNFSFY